MKVNEIKITEQYGRDWEREHTVPVMLAPKSVTYNEMFQEETTTPFEEGDIAYFSVYTTVRCYGGPEEGGWYYDADFLDYTIPFKYSAEAIPLMMEAETERVSELVYGDLNSVRGGQEAFIRIEAKAGEVVTTERPTYE
jgi:hypothetical protein